MAFDEVDIIEIHESYRQGKLDYLIGAGVSIDAGLPSWAELNNRLLELFFSHEYSEETKNKRKLPLEPEPDELAVLANIFVRRFNREPVVDLVRKNVGDDFPALLRKALYGTSGDVVLQALQYELAAALEPEAGGHLRRLLTTNFDDLLERAFSRLHDLEQNDDLVKRVRIVTNAAATTGGKVEFIHLHGYLPPNEEVEPQGSLVLSEQDFWRTKQNWATDILKNILFDGERDLLVVGMSLADPRLREILFNRARERDKGYECGETYVLLTRHQPARTAPLAERRAHKLLGRYESDYWKDLGVNIVPVEDLKLLPMLLRQIRLGDSPDEWCDRARTFLASNFDAISSTDLYTSSFERLYDEEVQREASDYLREQLRFVRPKFEVSLNEELTLGYFIPSPWGGAEISLAFRHTERPHDDSYIARNDEDGTSFQVVSSEKARKRLLNISSVADAQGAAGYSFVTGSLVEALYSSSHINRKFSNRMRQQWDSGRTFSSLLCVPIYGSRKWVPLGVGFMSSTRKKPFWNRLSANERLQLYALIRASFRELLGYGNSGE